MMSARADDFFAAGPQHGAEGASRFIVDFGPSGLIKQGYSLPFCVRAKAALIEASFEHAIVAHDLNAGIPLQLIVGLRRIQPGSLRPSDSTVLELQNSTINISIRKPENVAPNPAKPLL